MSLDIAESTAIGEQDLELIDAYWRAANYLSVGQIYLLGQSRCCGNRYDPSTSSRGCSVTGAPHRD